MKLIFFIPLLFLRGIIFSQARKEKSPADLWEEKVTIDAGKNVASGISLPFSSVKVLDYRFDTSKIGFIRGKIKREKKAAYYEESTVFRKIVPTKGLRHSVERFYNDYYQHCLSNDSMKLLVVIKRFWADPFPRIRKVNTEAPGMSRESDFNLYIQLEFLLENSSLYMPVRRIDTVFQFDPFMIDPALVQMKADGLDLYEYALIKLFESLDYPFYATKYPLSKKKRTLFELMDFYKKSADYPILKDSVFKKGVYLNFHEFRNNSPSVPSYKITKDAKAGVILFHDSGQDSSRITKYFGYCDGINIYCNDLKHPLIRAGNTFDFFTDRVDYYQLYHSSPNPGIGTINFTTRNKEKSLEPFQVDMETGDIY